MKRLAAAVAVLACAGAFAADCPQAVDVTATQMLGLWHADFEDRGPGATLLLEPHPDYAGNFRGAVNRNGERRQLAGDVVDGDLSLEESADGVHIAAIWIGEVVEDSCGREVRGSWKAEGSSTTRPFILKKM